MIQTCWELPQQNHSHDWYSQFLCKTLFPSLNELLKLVLLFLQNTFSSPILQSACYEHKFSSSKYDFLPGWL